MKIIHVLKSYWKVCSRPSVHFSLGFLTLGGFIAGIIFWGGFNTALELTNTETFCISCHEMEANVYQELQSTVHFSNGSGVRATCPDCHVPHNWTERSGWNWLNTSGRASRLMTPSSAETATILNTWTLPSNRVVLQSNTALH